MLAVLEELVYFYAQSHTRTIRLQIENVIKVWKSQQDSVEEKSLCLLESILLNGRPNPTDTLAEQASEWSDAVAIAITESSIILTAHTQKGSQMFLGFGCRKILNGLEFVRVGGNAI